MGGGGVERIVLRIDKSFLYTFCLEWVGVSGILLFLLLERSTCLDRIYISTGALHDLFCQPSIFFFSFYFSPPLFSFTCILT